MPLPAPGTTTRMTENTTSGARPLAVVTGASTGIGRALAGQLAEHGFDLIICADDDALEPAATELAAHGGEVTAVLADLATPLGVETLHRAFSSSPQPLEAAVLNAGIGVSGAFAETELEEHLRLVDLNVRSTVHLAKLVVETMVAQGRGRLMFTSSIAAVAPNPFQSTYGASKAFVQSFSQAIREELKDTGVTVTSLMPGPTDTEFFARADMEDTQIASGRKDDPEVVAKEAFEAMMTGRDSVVPGPLRNRVEAEIGTHVPDKLAAAVTTRLTKPGSGES
jgi:short-subunit dehydrogenase